MKFCCLSANTSLPADSLKIPVVLLYVSLKTTVNWLGGDAWCRCMSTCALFDYFAAIAIYEPLTNCAKVSRLSKLK